MLSLLLNRYTYPTNDVTSCAEAEFISCIFSWEASQLKWPIGLFFHALSGKTIKNLLPTSFETRVKQE